MTGIARSLPPVGTVKRLWRWPAPALLTWAAAWGVEVAALGVGMSSAFSAGAAMSVGLAAALGASSTTRRLVMALGFPVSLAASGVGEWPAWIWLVPLALLAVVYPIKLWGDAPVFPTPRGALDELKRLVDLPVGARILDAGCGSGSALRELHAAYPACLLHGIEWSWPLCVLAALRCPYAVVRRRDMWTTDWSRFDMVYVFQRPETMARIVGKAIDELRPGGVLVSLEFPVMGRQASAVHRCPDGRSVRIYKSKCC